MPAAAREEDESRCLEVVFERHEALEGEEEYHGERCSTKSKQKDHGGAEDCLDVGMRTLAKEDNMRTNGIMTGSIDVSPA